MTKKTTGQMWENRNMSTSFTAYIDEADRRGMSPGGHVPTASELDE